MDIDSNERHIGVFLVIFQYAKMQIKFLAYKRQFCFVWSDGKPVSLLKGVTRLSIVASAVNPLFCIPIF